VTASGNRCSKGLSFFDELKVLAKPRPVALHRRTKAMCISEANRAADVLQTLRWNFEDFLSLSA
jgi:hypothetical protein